MKSYTNLWSQITSWENLLLAARKARCSKRKRPNVARFEADLEMELMELRSELLERKYMPGQYRSFYIYEPKKRLISAAPYRDRVVHHALCNVIEPLFEKRFIEDSYANRRGKGTHAALGRYLQYSRSHRYVLRCDISRYFPSIDHEILYAKLSRTVRCSGARWLIRVIINASNPQEPVAGYFPGDDLFTPFGRRRGLPIGNQTSQFFANVYLDQFDHFVKEELRLPYVRYVDDFAVFANRKDILRDVRERMSRFLAVERLRFHLTKTRIYRTADGTSFVGYRVLPDRVRLPRQNLRRFMRRMRGYQRLYANGELEADDVRQRLRSWMGHAQHADAKRLVGELLQNLRFVRASGR